MKNDFLMIAKDALPPHFLIVAQAKREIEYEKKTVSEVCDKYGVSRSTYYKYKDKVFEPTEEYGRKAIFSFKTQNEPGVLSAVLNCISSFGCNVLTINQNMPIHSVAYFTVMVDAGGVNASLYEMLDEFKKIPRVREVSLTAFE